MKVTRKDLVYIIIILIIIMIFIASFNLLNLDGINSKLTFASTIASIILSVIAIVYTLTESIKSSSFQNELFSISKKIVITSESLEKSKEDFLNISKSFDNIEGIVNKLEIINNNVSCVNESNKELKKEFKDFFINTDSNVDNQISIDNMLDGMVGNKCIFEILVLILYIKENNLNFLDFLKEYFDTESTTKLGIAAGILASLSNAKLLKLESKTRQITEVTTVLSKKVISNGKYSMYEESIKNKLSSLNV